MIEEEDQMISGKGIGRERSGGKREKNIKPEERMEE